MAEQASMEDSNIANYGGQDHKDAKLAAAKLEPEYKDCGAKPGVEVWRVENMGIKKQKNFDGHFYSGDSYIVLHCYQLPDSQKKLYNVHFWLGEKTTQDEMGVAAYKTVELDDLLGDLPVQFRETQANETKEFLSLFPSITYLEGGVESGFNPVKPTEYTPRLLQLKRSGKTANVRVAEVECKTSSLNNGDVFILDAGLKLIQWNGTTANPWEKRKAGEVINQIKSDRLGKASSEVIDGDEDHELFWTTLGGKAPVADATPDVEQKAAEPKLYQVSDASGEVTTTEVASGNNITKSKLDSTDVFILDLGHALYVWIGSGATKQEKKSGMAQGVKFLESSGRPMSTPIMRLVQGMTEPKAFTDAFH